MLTRVALIDAPQSGETGHRIRLTGEAIANPRLGFARGCLVEHIVPGWYRDHLMACYDETFAEGKPHRQLVVVSFGLSESAYERLILPTTRKGSQVDMILVATGPPRDPATLPSTVGEGA